MKKGCPLFIGTSGCHYAHWKGPFYPAHLSSKKFLEYYAQQFQTLEINNSFYQLPKDKTVKQWRDTVGEDFVFSVKASRFITHMKKLKEPQRSAAKFFKVIKHFGNKLGPVLFQLPPRWRCNPKRLDMFLKELPQNHKYAFEFRDPSWFRQEVNEILKKHNSAFCMYDLAGRLSPEIVTADFIYIRLHGPGVAYSGCYSTEALSQWARSFDQWKKKVNPFACPKAKARGMLRVETEGPYSSASLKEQPEGPECVKEIYCYFDNDQAGYAPQNALQLKHIVG